MQHRNRCETVQTTMHDITFCRHRHGLCLFLCHVALTHSLAHPLVFFVVVHEAKVKENEAKIKNTQANLFKWTEKHLHAKCCCGASVKQQKNKTTKAHKTKYLERLRKFVLRKAKWIGVNDFFRSWSFLNDFSFHLLLFASFAEASITHALFTTRYEAHFLFGHRLKRTFEFGVEKEPPWH